MRNRRERGHRPQGNRGRRPFSGRERQRGADEPILLYGWHSVQAALENPNRRVRKLFATENAVRRLAEAGIVLKQAPEIVRPETIAARLSPDAVHQGLLAEADPLPAPDISEVAGPLLLVLDQITDPHNVGAIVRTASAFGVAAIVTTARHSPEATGVLAKSASGGLEHVPFVLVQNLARALTELKERGFQLVGLDEDAPVELSQAVLHAPVALVLGAEGKGMRQLTRETCDLVARLTLPGTIRSLNVSNAAAVALHIVTTKIATAR